jgi:hypothetical protein
LKFFIYSHRLHHKDVDSLEKVMPSIRTGS